MGTLATPAPLFRGVGSPIRWNVIHSMNKQITIHHSINLKFVALQAPIFGTAMELLIFRNWLDWLPQVHAGPAPALVEVASFKSKPLPIYQDISIAWRKIWNMCTKTALVHRTKNIGATSKMEVPNHQDIQVLVFSHSISFSFG